MQHEISPKAAILQHKTVSQPEQDLEICVFSIESIYTRVFSSYGLITTISIWAVKHTGSMLGYSQMTQYQDWEMLTV